MGVLVNAYQAAELAGIHERNLRRHIHTGTLPAKKVGRAYRIDVDDLLKLPGGANITQPEVPVVGPRLFPSPEQRRRWGPFIDFAVRVGVLVLDLLPGVPVFVGKAVYWSVALLTVPLTILWLAAFPDETNESGVSSETPDWTWMQERAA